MMNTLIRNTTKSFNRELDGYGYEQLDQSEKTREEKNHGRRTFSRRKSHNNMVHSLSYIRDRAKQRRIFLKSYKFISILVWCSSRLRYTSQDEVPCTSL
ncbi:hypothetical protein CFP56_031908 [Quercus suber]|uniref:Uncharacterized protein n=1 Tax=Quercus suber TaxID=58331 RepID=A0AAW0LSP4_QUESU